MRFDFYELERQGLIRFVAEYGNTDRPDCLHQNQIPTRFVNSAQNVSVVMQCLTCGAHLRNIPKSTAPDVDGLEDFDHELRSAWNKAVSERYRWLREAKRAAESDKWWASYNEFLNSIEWRELRAKVMNRARGTCEGCLTRAAEQVHHTTYRYGFSAPAFLLVAVCNPCHERITQADREGRTEE